MPVIMTANTTPRVSVVIPLYQTERYIVEAVCSVLAQSYSDFEVLVIDDGSRDGGPALVQRLPDSRIRLISQSNRGLAGARNTGIREARGKYIAFLDADDRWHPAKLARHVALLDARSDVGLSYSASRLVGDDGEDLGMAQWPSRATTRPQDIFARNPVGNGSAPVLRRAALDAIAFHDPVLGRDCWFDESFGQSEDIECWMRLVATTSWQLALVPFVLTDYRVNTTGLSANTKRQLETWRRFRAKVKDYAPALERAHGDLAEAYQLRYLARRAVKGGDGRVALRMMHEALALSPAIAVEEPIRTAVTYAAALVASAMPSAIVERCINRSVFSLTPSPQSST
jgi:glycosyltransferase involved in cell wall biosynthesis